MSNEIKAELDSLVVVITNILIIDEIYLFGTFAYGNPNEDSDLDIYVVIPDDSIRPIEAAQKIRLNILPYQKHPVNLLVGKHSSFMKRKASPSFIENEIYLKGIKIYG